MKPSRREPTKRDLFGKKLPFRRPRYEWSLSIAEQKSVPIRAARIRWLNRVIPRNYGFGMPLETAFVFMEAKNAFIYGCFVSCTMMAAAFVEHWLASRLRGRGYKKSADGGLRAIIECCRENALIADALLLRVDRLRQIRNPFAHLKDYDHPHGLNRRIMSARTDPETLLEQDAKDSLTTMYSIAIYTFKSS